MGRARIAIGIVGALALLLLVFLFSGGPRAFSRLSGAQDEDAGVDDEDASDTSERGVDAGTTVTAGEDAGVFPVERAFAPIRLSPARAEIDTTASGILEGRVLAWGTGRGVSGAELTFASNEATASVSSAIDGAFRFEPPASGSWSLALVTAEHFTPFAPEWGHSPIVFVARARARVTGVEVFLENEQLLTGRVVDETGAPVAEASVHILAEGGGHALLPSDGAATSDAEGAFSIIAPDDAILEASSEEHGRGRAIVGATVQISRRITITLHPPDEATAGDATIRGHVLDDAGHAVESALVRVVPLAPPDDPARELHPSLQALSSEDGSFEIRGADRGPHYVTATASGFAPASRGRVEAPADDVTLVLGRGGAIVVHATDEAGAAIVGLTVMVERALGAIVSSVVAVASSYDTEGEVEVRDLEAGDYEIEVSAPGLAPTAPTVANVRAGASTRVDVVLRRGATITGRVTSDDGAPIVGARVEVEDRVGESSPVPISASTTTDDDGRFALTGLSAGLRSLVVLASDHHGRIRSGILVPETGVLDLGEISLSPVAEGEEPTLELVGIGAVLSAVEATLVVTAVLPGSGAAELGIGPGDAVLAVDGVSVATLRMEGAIERIRGIEGTSVHLRVRRGEEEVELDVPRRRVRR